LTVAGVAGADGGAATFAAALTVDRDIVRPAAASGWLIAHASVANEIGEVAPPSGEERLLEAVSFADGKPFTISGFYGLEAAYTYALPAHWSRAVNRLQIEAQGSLSSAVTYKLGVRADIDPVYYGSDFYLPAVKTNEQLGFIWRENYLDFSTGNWDFRLGAQNIVWGEVVGLFVADVVSAHDMREFLLPSFDIIRIPQWAARAEYSAADSHVEFVWIPFQTFDLIGRPGADFYPVPLPSPTSPSVASIIGAVGTPARTLSNSAYGVRANMLFAGWDLAVLYYRSFSSEPTYYRAPNPDGTGPRFQPRYDRIWQAGATATKDLDIAVVRAEAVYAHGQRFASTDPNAAQGVVERPTLDYVVSAEFPLPSDVRLNLQAFQRIYSGGRGGVALDTGDFGASVLLSGKVGQSLEPQILWIQTFGGGGSLVRPRLNWYPEKNTAIGVGVDIFTGAIDGFFGRYNNRDRVYTEVRYSF
jgi:hypothetical protein